MNFVHIWHTHFLKCRLKKFPDVFNFAKPTKISEIRENMYTKKLVRFRH